MLFYAHHRKSAQDLQERLDAINEFARKENLIIILGGDFKAKHGAWNCDHDDVKGKIIIDTICDNKWNLLNSNDNTFHRRNGYESTLDLTIVGERITNKVISWNVDTYDHFPIRFDLRLSSVQEKIVI